MRPTTIGGRLALLGLHVLPRQLFSRLMGWLADARPPRWLLNAVLDRYIRAYRVELDQAVVPAEGFRSFNQFFTRALRPGLRPLDDDPRSVLCPADGRLEDLGPIDGDTRFLLKGSTYDVAELLDDATAAEAYRGGSYAVVYLSPRDYHRVHSPVAGTVRAVRHIPGTLYPVNSFGLRFVPQLFARNERAAVHIDSPSGRFAVVFVGALIVGRIRLTIPAPRRPSIGGTAKSREFTAGDEPKLGRGDELGAFELGSTIVLLLPPGVELTKEPGRPAKVGEALARIRT